MIGAITSKILGSRVMIGVVFLGVLLLISGSSLVSAQDNLAEDPVEIFNRAQDLHEKGDLKGAVALYEKALLALPEFPEAEHQRGIAYLALKNIDAAEIAFRRAVELRPGWILAMNSLASLCISLGKSEEAARLLHNVIETDPYNPPALTALTELRLRSNAPTAVLRDLLSKISVLTSKANPTLSLWTARSALEIALGQREAAKASLTKALAFDSANTQALLLLGDLSLAEGDTEKAREIAAKLDRANTQLEPAIILKAKVLAFDGHFDQALDLIKEFANDRHGISQLRNQINIARSTSREDLERQLKDNDRNVGVLGRLCTLLRRDDPAKALDYCRKASELEPGNISHAIGFGAALVQARQFESAVELLTRIVKLAHDNSTARANLATALFQLKRYAEAKAEFLWLAREQPGSAGAFYFLGILHDQMSEYMDAAASYQQYLKLADPVQNKLDIEKVNLRLPQIQRLIRDGKGKKSG